MCTNAKKMDVLGRQLYIDRIVEMIDNVGQRKEKLSFAIDGCWGAGKTFLIERLEKQLDEKGEYFVFHYNCWEYDYYAEPIIAIVSAMIDCAKNRKISAPMRAGWDIVTQKLKEIAQEIIKNRIGVDVIGIYDKFADTMKENEENEKAFDLMWNFREVLNKLQKEMREISKEKPVIIVVDELDRCLPEYAIRILERMHHFFEQVDNIIIIFAIDGHQLDASIKQIYGDDVSSEQYLKKFISFTMLLDRGNIIEDYWKQYDSYFSMFIDRDRSTVFSVIKNLFTGVDIRSQEKIIERSALIHRMLWNEIKMDSAVMLFELIIGVVKFEGGYRSAGNDIDCFWDDVFQHISQKTYSGSGIMHYILELAQSVGDGRERKEYGDQNTKSIERLVFGDRIVDRLFYLAYGTCGKHVKLVLQHKYIHDYEGDLEFCKKYMDFNRVIL